MSCAAWPNKRLLVLWLIFSSNQSRSIQTPHRTIKYLVFVIFSKKAATASGCCLEEAWSDLDRKILVTWTGSRLSWVKLYLQSLFMFNWQWTCPHWWCDISLISSWHRHYHVNGSSRFVLWDFLMMDAIVIMHSHNIIKIFSFSQASQSTSARLWSRRQGPVSVYQVV